MIDQLFGGLFAPQRHSVFPDSAEYLASALAAQAAIPTGSEPRWRSIDPKRRMTDEQLRLFQTGNLLSRA